MVLNLFEVISIRFTNDDVNMIKNDVGSPVADFQGLYADLFIGYYENDECHNSPYSGSSEA